MSTKAKNRSILPSTPEGSRISVHLKVKVRSILTAAGVTIAPRTSDGDLIGALVTELKRRIESAPKTAETTTSSSSAAATITPASTLLTMQDPKDALQYWLANQTDVITPAAAFLSSDTFLYFGATTGQPGMPHATYRAATSKTYNVLVVYGRHIRLGQLGDCSWASLRDSHGIRVESMRVESPQQQFGGTLTISSGKAKANLVNETAYTHVVAQVELDSPVHIQVIELQQAISNIDMIVVLEKVEESKTVQSTPL